MATLLTKVATGINFGDVSNQAIRNILTQISLQQFGKFTEQEMIDTLEFFDWKCPYTGKDLKELILNKRGGYATDHIYPQNRMYCGLNIKGNLIFVDAEANKKKHDKDFKDFMRDRQFDDILGTSMEEREKRIAKIVEFQKSCNYDPEKIKESISPILIKRYDEVRREQEEVIKMIIEKMPSTGQVQKTTIANDLKTKSTQLVFIPSDEDLFKKELLQKKEAIVTLYYDSGIVKKTIWKVNNLESTSNLRGNIQSRPFWRNRKSEGLVKVELNIAP